MKKKTTTVEFTVTYNPALIEKVGEVMSRCDLGVVAIEYLQEVIVQWKTSTLVDDKYIKKMKKQLRKFYIQEGCKVIRIIRV